MAVASRGSWGGGGARRKTVKVEEEEDVVREGEADVFAFCWGWTNALLRRKCARMYYLIYYLFTFHYFS